MFSLKRRALLGHNQSNHCFTQKSSSGVVRLFFQFPALVRVTILPSSPRTVVLTFLAPLKKLTKVPTRALAQAESSWEPVVVHLVVAQARDLTFGRRAVSLKRGGLAQVKTREHYSALWWQSRLSKDL
ncbi:hypothetical protein DEO72_LG3g453 [Vigna unguiculata]|uniref:Uncharacterized protein n=1 Tax=Vigna unguiculata TaxID=3917 RepID=A0A4D6LBI3_VIGUN|nr:hypothetical protein DEO72_LG3g453 [Vigna unguiculata]